MRSLPPSLDVAGDAPTRGERRQRTPAHVSGARRNLALRRYTGIDVRSIAKTSVRATPRTAACGVLLNKVRLARLGVLLATVPSLGLTSLMRPHARVLIVDDDPVICELVAMTLADQGYATRRASDAREALHLIELETPDVVLLDVHLPDLSGYQLCRRLRQLLGDTMGIMLISGERKEAFDRAAGLLLGADDYLVKPFVLDELLARVHRLAQRSRPVTLSVAARLTRREAQVLRMLAT